MQTDVKWRYCSTSGVFFKPYLLFIFYIHNIHVSHIYFKCSYQCINNLYDINKWVINPWSVFHRAGRVHFLGFMKIYYYIISCSISPKTWTITANDLNICCRKWQEHSEAVEVTNTEPWTMDFSSFFLFFNSQNIDGKLFFNLKEDTFIKIGIENNNPMSNTNRKDTAEPVWKSYNERQCGFVGFLIN